MDGNKKNLQSLTMDELTGVINLYPWFGGARKELCARMAKVGGHRHVRRFPDIDHRHHAFRSP